MARRNCATCRFYERSSIARMGWCRHPELYASHYNHLVAADDLDCDRGTGDYWESHEAPDTTSIARHSGAARDRHPISLTTTGSPVFPVSGSSGYGEDPPPVPGGSGGGPSWGNGDRDYNYYEEERYWTDYLRIAAPVLGVILLVVLLWFWIASFLNDDDNGNGDVASGTATTELPTFESSPEDPGENGGTSSPPPTTTVPPSGGDATATEDGGETNGSQEGNGETGISLGATVEVANTDGAGVNVRSEPTTAGEVLTVFLDGTQIEVTDGPVEAEDFTWWQITGNEVASGWIVSEYLVVVE